MQKNKDTTEYMIRTIQILVFILFAIIANAQDLTSSYNAKKNQISVGTGIAKYIIQDDVISPLIYKGKGIPVWLKYKYLGTKLVHHVQIYFSRSDLHSNITNLSSNFPHNTDNINAHLNYKLGRKIFSFNKEKADVFVGGQFLSYLNFQKHYCNKYYQSSTGDQNTSLGIVFMLDKRYNSRDDLISFNVSFPIVSYSLSSGMYNANVVTDHYGDFVFVNKLFEVQSEVSFYHSLNNTIALGLNYFFHFYNFEKHPDLNNVKFTNNQILLEMLIRF